MGYTSEYAKNALNKHGKTKEQRLMEKERKFRSSATKATLYGEDKKASRLTKRANRSMKRLSKLKK